VDDRIGRINLAGVVTEYPLPSPFQEPRGITRGPEPTVWFTETGSHFGAEGIGKSTRRERSRNSRFRLVADPSGSRGGPMATCGSHSAGSHGG
jgi:virginiamycin B lyase